MVSSVDERIVAAKFDSSDFEKGVDKTIKKLDELKKSFDLKETTKSVKDLADKTESSTKSIGKSLDTLTDRLTTFTGMIKQRILGGLADEVAGVFLKMEQSIKNFVTGISTQQISAGMGKYEAMLTAVRVMMSSGQTEEDAYEAIGVLRDYSDQTSYSLSQMSDALSKLVASGSDLDTATKAVQGIANACASAGVNATDAARAYYNLAQAYSKGNLQYTDYKSLELLNMTNVNFKEQLLEAAAAAGTLEKTMKKVKQADGTFKETAIYKTTNKKDKKVKGGKAVDVNNLSEMLKYDFVNNEVMNKLFGENFYFGEKEWKEILKKNKGDREAAYNEAIKQYGKIAVEAYHAAREARNFTDVINTIKDVVSTGWSTTFEHLFGRLEQAKEFFTSLAEGELADVVYKIGEYRNAILGYWNALDIEGNGTGGVLLRQTILNLSDALGTLFKTFLSVLPGFEELDNTEEEGQATLKSLGENLKLFTARVRDASISFKEAMEKFSKWMHSPMFENGPTRIEAIRSALSNLLSVVGIAGRLLGIAFSALGKVFTVLSPVFDGFLIFLDKVTGPLKDLKNNDDAFKNIEYTIGNILTILTPIANVLGKVVGFLGEIGAFFVDMAISTFTMNLEFFSDALGLVLELLTGHSMQELDEEGISVLGKLNKSFTEIKDACTEALGALKEFFSSVIEDLKVLFGLAEPVEGEEGGFFANLKNFFDTNEFVQSAKAWVDQAIIDVGDFIKSIPERVKKFGENIYNTLYSLFFYEETKYNGSMLETRTYKTELYKWLEQAIEDIKNFIISIPDRIIKGVGTVASWINVVFDKLLGTGESTENKDTSEAKEKAADGVKTSFDEFIDNVATSIKEWFDDLPNKIQAAFTGIGDFVSRLYNTIDTFLFGRKYSKKTYNLKTRQYEWVESRYKSGFSKWLDGFIEEIKKFIKKIPEYIKLGIKGAGDILNTIVNAIFGVSDSEKNAAATGKELENKLKAPFESVNLTSILDKIKEIGETILNQIIRCFTGTEDIEFNMQWFSDKIAEGITWIKEKAISSWESIKAWFIALPTNIANFFKGENAEKQEEGTVGAAILSFATTIGGFILDLPSTIMGFFTTAISELSGIWDMLYKQITGTAEEGAEKATSASSESLAPNEESADTVALKSKWDEFVDNIGKFISAAFANLPSMIAQGLDMAVIGIDAALKEVSKLLNPEKKISWFKKPFAGLKEKMTVGAKAEEKEGDSALVKALISIGEHIKDLIVTTIPKAISDAWTAISGTGSEIWNGFTSIFDPNITPESDVAIAVHNFGIALKEFIIKDIPDAINKAWEWVKNFVANLINPNKNEPWHKKALNGFMSSITNVTKNVNKDNGIKDSVKADTGLFGVLKEAVTSTFDLLFSEKGILSGDVEQKLSNFFLHTVPNLIGKIIGELFNSFPEVIASFSEGLISTAGAESAKENAKSEAESAEEVSTRISNAFATILEKLVADFQNGALVDTGKTILILLAVVEFLKAIKEIISTINVMGHRADAKEASNSFTATMKRMMTALIAAFALVGYLSTLPEGQRKDAKEILKDLVELFEQMALLTTIGKGVGDITGTIRSFTDLANDQVPSGTPNVAKATGFWGKTSDALGGLTSKILGVAGAVGSAEIVQYGIQDIIASVVQVFENLASGFETVSTYIERVVGIFTKIKTDIDTSIEVVGKLDNLFSPLADLSKYQDDINTINSFMPSLSGALDTFKKAVSGRNIHAKGIVDSLKELIELRVEMGVFAFYAKGEEFEDFKYALASLGSALSMFSLKDVDTSKTDASITSAVKIMKAVMQNSELLETLKDYKFGDLPDPKDIYSSSEKIIILAGAIASISNAAANIPDDADVNLGKLFRAVSSIDVPEEDASKKINDVSGQFSTLGLALGAFADNTSGLTEDKLKTTGIAIDIMTQLMEKLKGKGQGLIEKFFEGDESLSSFGSGISTLGTKIASFFRSISEVDVYDADKIALAIKAVRTFASSLEDINHKDVVFKSNFGDLANGLDTLGPAMVKFFDGFKVGAKSWKGVKSISISDSDITSLTRVFDFLKIIAEVSALGNGQNANTELGELANQLKLTDENSFGSVMIKFFETVGGLEVSESSIKAMDSFGVAISSIAKILNMANVAQDHRDGRTSYDKMVSMIKDTTSMFAQFNKDYEDMQTFFTNAKEFDQDGIEAAKNLFIGLRELATAMFYVENTDIETALSRLEWFDWNALSTILSDKFLVSAEEYKEKFAPIGTEIATIISKAVEDAFNNPDGSIQPEITIRPVIHFDQDYLNQQINSELGLGGEYTLDMNALVKSISGLGDQQENGLNEEYFDTKFLSITDAIKDLSDNTAKVSDVSNALGGMTMVLDTGTLAGAMANDIDAIIGDKVWLVMRGNSVYSTTK